MQRIEKLVEQTEHLLSLRADKEALEQDLKELNSDIRATESEIVRIMRDHQIDSIAQHGFSFSVYSKLVAKKTDEEALYDWLEANGYGGVIKRTVHHMTLTRVVQETLEESGKSPDGIEVSFFDVLSLRKKGEK